MSQTGTLSPLRYYNSLDGVRGIAALMIMFLHFMPDYEQASHPLLFYLKKISVGGQAGVMLFFVLSGFLITRILLHDKVRQDYFRRFYLRRSLRIFPLYYLFLIICFIVIPFLSQMPLPPLSVTWYYYFYLQNVAMTFNWKDAGQAHLWSLAVEEHFYLVWPVVVYLVSDKALKWIILGSVAAAMACRVLLIHHGYTAYFFTFSTFDCLTLGAFLALNEKHGWFTARAMIWLIILTIVPLCIGWPLVTGMANDYVQYFKVLVISLCCMGLIGIVTLKETPLNRFFSQPFMRYTGKISYGLYVFHPLCFYYAARFVNTNIFLADLLIRFGLAYLVASVSYFGFERHFLKLKEKL